jgi:hypothetical protein
LSEDEVIGGGIWYRFEASKDDNSPSIPYITASFDDIIDMTEQR